MQAGLWGRRGLNQFISSQGEGFYFTLRRDSSIWEYFFFNVGQPWEQPPLHEDHIDDRRFNSNIEIMSSEFSPFQAYYSLEGNAFFWFEYQEAVVLQAHCRDVIQFYPCSAAQPLPGGWWRLGPEICVWGLDWELSRTGEITLIVSSHPLPSLTAQASRLLPPGLQYEDSPSRIARHAVFYNLMTSTRLRHRFYLPVNKAWLPMISRVTQCPDGEEGPLIFAWDAAFSAIILSRSHPGLAKLTLFSLFEGLQSDGRIPQLRVGDRFSNRSNPPVWFLAVWEIYQAEPDREFLQACLPILEKNYNWWKQNRMRADYSYSWGTDNETDETLIRLFGRMGAIYESGLDDSPVFEEMHLEQSFRDGMLEVSLLNQSCIDLSCLIYQAAEILLDISAILGCTIAGLEEDLENYHYRVHRFFDLEHGRVNSQLDGHFNPQITPLVFYPLLTSALKAEEVSFLEALFYSEHFQGMAGLPSLSCLSESFHPDGDYWKGRIWPPLLYLCAQGFKKYQSPVYQDIKAGAEALLVQEWKRHGHIHENYSSLTGQGEPQAGVYARSCPFYSWGGLLGII